MFTILSMLARLRVLALTILLLHPSFSYALTNEQKLYASSVTYCDPPEAILVDQLDVTYFNSNQSVYFNVSAASVAANLNVTANVLLNVYGMTPVNLTLDLCDMLGGVLCPLPEYTFVGSDSLTLPSSLGIADYIPAIAFSIPDLEGFAQVKLTEVGTGDVKACIQVTLSNGWSTQQTAVSWTTASIAIVVLLLSLYLSARSPHSAIPHRFLDLMTLFQTIALSSFLDLNYPSLYRAFTLNFAWALGLFTTPSSQVQASIDNMRALTGGSMANSSTDSAIAYVNRKLSPYNYNSVTGSSTSSMSIFKRDLAFPVVGSTLPIDTMLTRRDGVDTVTSASSNVLEAGVPLYTNSLHIGTANAFMTAFLFMLCLIAIMLAAFALLYAVVRLAPKVFSKHADAWEDFRGGYVSYLRSWGLRVFLVIMLPLLVLSMYQWTLHDSWLVLLLSIITFLAIFASIVGIAFVLLRGSRVGAGGLYDYPTLVSFSPLIEQYHAHRFYLFFPSLALPVLKAIMIAAGKKNGLAQLIVLIILEISTVLMPIVLRPYKTRGGDVFSTYISLVRLVCTGLMLAFVEALSVGAILRVVIGCVVGVIFCITIIVILVNILVHLYHHSRPVIPSQNDSDKSLATECGTNHPSWEKRSNNTTFCSHSPTSSASSHYHDRPRNPTPNHNHTGASLDPSIYQAYPENTPPSATTDHFNPRDSASTTLGTLLPRRFSITPLSSPETFEFSHSHSHSYSHSHSSVSTPTGSESSCSSVTLSNITYYAPSPVESAHVARHCSNDRTMRS